MKRTWLWCLLPLLSLGSASLSQAQQASGATEKAILALEDQWMQSQKTNNPDLVAPLLADKFVETNGVGRVQNKAEFLARERATKYSSVEYLDRKVTVFGDTAIATGDLKFQGTDESGASLSMPISAGRIHGSRCLTESGNALPLTRRT